MRSKNYWYSLSPKSATILAILCITYILFRLGQMYVKAEPQDFHIYYYSVIAHDMGINEYSIDGLKQASNGKTKFGFVYPPYARPVFKPFTLLSDKNGARLYLTIKIILFAFLFASWMKYLPMENRKTDLAFMLLLVSVGYYECTYTDFKNGNISAFEQFFLWMGALFFFRGRYNLYALFVFLASFFKLALIPFLGVLFFVPKKKGWPAFLLGSALFFALQSIGYLSAPEDYIKFFSGASGLEETGPLNPSSMMLFRASLGWISKDFANIAYAISATILALAFLRINWPKESKKFDSFFLFIGYCFLYAMVMPRFKNYSFMLLVFPTYWMLQNALPQKKWLFWVLILALVAHVAPYQTWSIAAFMMYLWFKKSRSTQSQTDQSLQTNPQPL